MCVRFANSAIAEEDHLRGEARGGKVSLVWVHGVGLTMGTGGMVGCQLRVDVLPTAPSPGRITCGGEMGGHLCRGICRAGLAWEGCGYGCGLWKDRLG